MKEGQFSLEIFTLKQNNLLYYDISPGVEAFSTMLASTLPYPVLQPHQTHGINVRIIDNPSIDREDLYDTDALMTNLVDFAIAVRTADCIPVLMFDPKHLAVAAVHSGWKGTVKKISSHVIEKMHEVYGTSAEDIIAQIGPGIGPESFQVGPEVVSAFEEAGFPMEDILLDCGPVSEKFSIEANTNIEGQKSPMDGGLHIDLWKANQWILRTAGVKCIKTSGICTYKRNDLFHSARRESAKCPRIINSIKILDEDNDKRRR